MTPEVAFRRRNQAVRGGKGCVGASARRRCRGVWRPQGGMDIARISYDEQTAAAYKAVREVQRDGLSEWREAVRRHLRPTQGMTLVDIGAGTGQFTAAFSDWFDLNVLAVEPSAAETARTANTFPSLQHTREAFAAPGFHQDALEQVRETYPTSLAAFLGQMDTLRRADTTL